ETSSVRLSIKGGKSDPEIIPIEAMLASEIGDGEFCPKSNWLVGDNSTATADQVLGAVSYSRTPNVVPLVPSGTPKSDGLTKPLSMAFTDSLLLRGAMAMAWPSSTMAKPFHDGKESKKPKIMMAVSSSEDPLNIVADSV